METESDVQDETNAKAATLFKGLHSSGVSHVMFIEGSCNCEDDVVNNLIKNALLEAHPQLDVTGWIVNVEEVVVGNGAIDGHLKPNEGADAGTAVNSGLVEAVAANGVTDCQANLNEGADAEATACASPLSANGGISSLGYNADDWSSPARKKLDSRSTPQKMQCSKPWKFSSPRVGLFRDVSEVGFPTCKVKVIGLPVQFKDNFLLYELNKALVRINFSSKLDKPVEKVIERRPDGTAIVQCSCVDAATALSKLSNITVQSKAVQFEQIDDFSRQSALSKKVCVRNLPDDYEEDILLYVLNSALWTENFCAATDEPAMSVTRGNGAATVEFSSVEAAAEVSKLLVEYCGDVLDLEHIENLASCLPKKVLSRKVRVSSLPIVYKENLLLYELNKALSKAYFCSPKEKPALKVVQRECGSAIVEFITVEAASTICQLPEIEFLKKSLQLEQVEEACVDFCVNTKTNRLSKYVVVSNLPEDFEEDILLYEINSSLKHCCEVDEPAVKVLTQLDFAGSTTVQFISVEAARQACAAQIEYCGEILYMKQEMENGSSSSGSCIAGLNALDLSGGDCRDNSKTSEYVLVQNLPPQYEKDAFIEFFNEKMFLAGNTFDQHDCIEKCQDYSSETKSVVVKFSCSEEAKLATLLEGVVYRGFKLKISNHTDENHNSKDMSDTEAAQEEDEVQEIRTLEDEGAGDLFLNLLIKYRNDFPKSGKHDTALENLRKILIKKGIRVTLPEVRKMRKKLRELHTRNKSSDNVGHRLFKACSVAFDGKNPLILKGSNFEVHEDEDEDNDSDGDDNDDKFLRDLIKYSETASWTNRSTKALVEVCLDYREDYHKPIRREKFWRKISSGLYEKKFVYGPQKCKNKMEQLSKEYRNYCDEAERTGAPGPVNIIPDGESRKLMEKMHDLEQDSVTANPKKIISAGAQSLEKTRDDVVQKGRNRHPILKRKSAEKERKMAMEERKAATEEKKAEALFMLAQKMP